MTDSIKVFMIVPKSLYQARAVLFIGNKFTQTEDTYEEGTN